MAQTRPGLDRAAWIAPCTFTRHSSGALVGTPLIPSAHFLLPACSLKPLSRGEPTHPACSVSRNRLCVWVAPSAMPWAVPRRCSDVRRRRYAPAGTASCGRAASGIARAQGRIRGGLFGMSSDVIGPAPQREDAMAGHGVRGRSETQCDAVRNGALPRKALSGPASRAERCTSRFIISRVLPSSLDTSRATSADGSP